MTAGTETSSTACAAYSVTYIALKTSIHILHKADCRLVVVVLRAPWFHFLAAITFQHLFALYNNFFLSLSPQKIRVLPAVGKDPESQRSERIKVRVEEDNFNHRAILTSVYIVAFWGICLCVGVNHLAARKYGNFYQCSTSCKLHCS